MTVFKVKWMTASTAAHVYCRAFSAPNPEHTFASLGNLTIRKNEFDALKAAFSGATFEEEDLNR